MKTPAANQTLVEYSDNKLAPGFPQLVPLSQAEQNKLRSNIKLEYWIWSIMGIGLPLAYAWQNDISWADFSASFNDLFLVITNAILTTLYLAIAAYFISRSLKDAKNGVKQVGLIEVVSKSTTYHSNTGTRYHVHVKWLTDPQGKEVIITDPCLYDYVHEGDAAYLELLPLSKQVLLVQKQEAVID